MDAFRHPPAAPGFWELFAENNLPVPPLPQTNLPVLFQVDAWLYATHQVPFSLTQSLLPLESLQEAVRQARHGHAVQPASGVADPCAFFVCGVSGQAPEQWRFRYVYAGEHLQVGIVLPSGTHTKNRDIPAPYLHEAFSLLKNCFQHMHGDGFGNHKDTTLCWTLDVEGLHFCLLDAQGQTLYSGAGFSEISVLLDRCDETILN